jgi:acyl-coenzyme A thioesterase PaaI-like protein
MFWSERSTISGMSNPSLLGLYGRLARVPFGRRLFSLGVSWKAPYFRTIRPVFVDLAPGRAEVRAKNRWSVHNHIGTFHAIACCNLAEIAAGTAMEATLQRSHRWIPKGMTVGYLAKAETDLHAVAVVPDLSGLADDETREVVVPVDIRDTGGTVVVHADIAMWVSPRSRARENDAPATGARA